MKTSKNKNLTVITIAALSCVTSVATAQDTPGRWYLGLDAGVAFQQDIAIKDTGGAKLSFDPGVRLDLSGGVHISPAWRAELDLGFIYNPVRAIGDKSLDSGSGGLDYFQVPMMANAIYTLPLHGPISAY